MPIRTVDVSTLITGPSWPPILVEITATTPPRGMDTLLVVAMPHAITRVIGNVRNARRVGLFDVSAYLTTKRLAHLRKSVVSRKTAKDIISQKMRSVK